MWLGQGRKHQSFAISIERDPSGLQRAWCLDLAGCAALVPIGGDPLEYAHAAVVEFLDWERASVRKGPALSDLAVVATVPVPGDIRNTTLAFFPHDAGPVAAQEFPGWANAHDLALDEFCDIVGRVPETLRLAEGTPVRRTILEAAAETAMLAENLGRPLRMTPAEDVKMLREMQRRLQEAVCAVEPDLLTHGADGGRWSVRRVMRVSNWSLRRQSWRVRSALAELWVAH